MENKPVLTWDKKKLEEKMNEIGFSVEFNKKPITLEGLSASGYSFKIDYINNDSIKKIQSYLDKEECDGALVLNTYKQRSLVGHNTSYGNITITPYVLNPLE